MNLSFSDDQPAPPLIGQFRATYYYTLSESFYSQSPADSELHTMNDEVLAHVSSAFKHAVDIEGSGKLLDGRVINFSGRKNGENRYRTSQNDFGDGAGNCALVPYHTIAVDRRTLPLGTVVQIDETIGMELPDGTLHDGIWRAEDVGSAIRGDRIDLYMGEGNQRTCGLILQKQGISNLQALTIRQMNAPQPGNCTGH